jgi:ATP-dependent Lon protease
LSNKKTKSLELPLLPLRGVIVFPNMVIHLDVGRERSVHAIDEAMTSDRKIFLVMQKEAQTDEPGLNDIYHTGTIAEIKQLLKLPGGTIRVLVEGLARATIKEVQALDPYVRVEVNIPSEEYQKTLEIEALMRNLNDLFEQYVKASRKISPETVVAVVDIEEPGRLADVIASHLSLKVSDKQSVLEAANIKRRLELLCRILANELEILELERRISARVRKQMEKTQKEYYLREQLKAIQKELGERDERTAETDDLRERIEKTRFPKLVREKALKELERLEKMPPMVAEATVVRNYLDWLLALPWSKETKDRLDINMAEQILDEDHYGLKDVKDRILEYLAIRQLSKKMRGPILCFVGPPGVGKTSLAKSIARCLERKFVRMSLGGVRDEAEIRGHRRTYVGAMPGRIIQGMKQAGTRNPVILMDEIDKLGTDFRGDPSSALLEVLDPEQNNSFSDHYIEVSYDLSKVMFITTANVQHSIPRPLLDRMEVISIPGYTEEEKLQIALRHLLKKQITEHGLSEDQISISENALRRIIREYTREAGVRNLEREIAALCRKTARDIVAKKIERAKITAVNIEGYLGMPRFRYGLAEKEDEMGVATGLAVTEVGGDVLSVEAILENIMDMIGYVGIFRTIIRTLQQNLPVFQDFEQFVDLDGV